MAPPITLSPSALGNFRESPRAFWLEKKHGIKRPQGIFSAMPNAIDAIIKERYDAHRGKLTDAKDDAGVLRSIPYMPTELVRLAKQGVSLFADYAKLKKMRNWRSAPVFVDPKTGARLCGALDDALVVPSEESIAVANPGDPTSKIVRKIVSLDVKTTRLRDNLGEYSAQYYLLSQSCYHLMLDAEHAAGGFNSHNPKIDGVGDRAALAYYMPEASSPNDADVLRWRCEVLTMPVDRALALEVLQAAHECLAGPMPAPGRNEDWDDYIHNYAAQVRIEEEGARVAALPKAEATAAA